MSVIDFDDGVPFQPVYWRLSPEEQVYAIYEDAGWEGGGSYIAFTDKRVLIPDWEFLYADIAGVERNGKKDITLVLQTLEGKVTLMFKGSRQADYAQRIVNQFTKGC
jgi:hypothetical protein